MTTCLAKGIHANVLFHHICTATTTAMLRWRRHRNCRLLAILFFAGFLVYKFATAVRGLVASIEKQPQDGPFFLQYEQLESAPRVRRNGDTNVFIDKLQPNKSENVEEKTSKSNSARQILQPYELMTQYIWNIPKIQFLEDFRSPCFYEQRQGLAARKNTVERALTMGGGKYMRCMPYFMFAGFPKCGTTDMYQRLIKHKFIATSFSKEPLWWSITRHEDPSSTFANYLDHFIPAAQKTIVRRGDCDQDDKTSCHPLLVADFSTRELLQERQPFTSGQNTWDLIKHVNPNMKFIVAMRNPVERLYSDFVYFSTVGEVQRITPQRFHEEVSRQITWWHTCVKRHNERTCLYGTHIEGMGPLRVHHDTCWEETFDDVTCGAFRLGFYYYYILDWLQTYPRENFLFLSTERYSEFTIGVINYEILNFLNLEPFFGEEKEDVMYMPRQYPLKTDAKQSLKSKHSLLSKMLPETRTLLEEFYRPSNKLLTDFLNDNNFLWYDKIEI